MTFEAHGAAAGQDPRCVILGVAAGQDPPYEILAALAEEMVL
jgi:hypothetical protein